MAKRWHWDVSSELVEEPHRNEDGERRVVEVFCVVGEDEDGYRVVSAGSGGVGITAQLDCEQDARLWDEAGVVPGERDRQVDPSYGSIAYQREGIEGERAQRERIDWREREDEAIFSGEESGSWR